MSRDVSTAFNNGLDDTVIEPFFAVELFFDNNQTLRLWTGIGELTYSGNVYYGTSTLLAVSAIEETAQISARGASLTLTGIPSSVVSLALSEPYQGRTAKIYFGLFNNTTSTVGTTFVSHSDGTKVYFESLVEVFVGYMDQMKIEESGDQTTIQLMIENKLIDLERPRNSRFTSEYQKANHPNDRGFEFVESMQDRVINWGRSDT